MSAIQADIDYAVAWLPPANVLRALPNLKVIFSLGAGVDAILSDPTLPDDVPIVRVNEPDLTMRMSEYVVLHVLMHHRQQRRIDENQKRKVWDSSRRMAPPTSRSASWGLASSAAMPAVKLAMLGFKVAGWSRTRKHIPGVHCYAGAAEFDSFLRPHGRAGLAAAAHARDHRHHQSRPYPEAVAKGAVRRADPHQCGTRANSRSKPILSPHSMPANSMPRLSMCS